MVSYRVLQPAYLGEGQREEGDIVTDEDLGANFKFEKARDGQVIEPIGRQKADRQAETNVEGDRTITDAKVSRDPRTDTGGTNDKEAKDLA